jgi:simple sugar transport system substrate-binding protein
MSDSDQVLDLPEHHDPREQDGGFDRRSFLQRAALTGVAGGSIGSILGACGSSASSGSNGGNSGEVFGAHPDYKFVFVNHATTNSFFIPTRYGASDASRLLGCSYQWTGSQDSSVSQMVDEVESAMRNGADGIALALIDLHAFNAPVEAAIKAGIPVVAYNADVPGNARLAYVGQDLFKAGEEMGKRIIAAVGSGEVALFIATPGSANLQPRIEGAEQAIRDSGKSITTHVVATGVAVAQEQTAIEAWYLSHRNAKGMYAVDGSSTESLAKVMQKLGLAAKGVHAGGFDLTEQTQQLLQEGSIEFTIDQQPYLQGFLPILELFLYKVSGTLTGPAEVDTGLKFLDRETVKPHVSTKSRFEGTSSIAALVTA